MEIDHIEKDGELVEFVDRVARNGITSLAATVANNKAYSDNKIADEASRASEVELSLMNSKVDKEEGKGLSSNDFTDRHKFMVEDPLVFSDMNKGVVPEAPRRKTASLPNSSQVVVITDPSKMFLRADGKWEVPDYPEYGPATPTDDGLMSADDKLKLNSLDPDMERDDYTSAYIRFLPYEIVQTLGNGKVISTKFNPDGSTSTEVHKPGTQAVYITSKVDRDGNIRRDVRRGDIDEFNRKTTNR